VKRSPNGASRSPAIRRALGSRSMPMTRAVGQGLEDGLGVATEPERAVDHDRAVVLEGRGQERDDPVEEDRDVEGTHRHSALSACCDEQDERHGAPDREARDSTITPGPRGPARGPAARGRWWCSWDSTLQVSSSGEVTTVQAEDSPDQVPAHSPHTWGKSWPGTGEVPQGTGKEWARDLVLRIRCSVCFVVRVVERCGARWDQISRASALRCGGQWELATSRRSRGSWRGCAPTSGA
jgi:hypothetical protein